MTQAEALPTTNEDRPDWIDRSEYPFASHYFELEEGRMHYIDEGQGRPLVMLHGTPTWSFLYRHIVKALSPDYRCIVPDHLGFGFSDKPPHLLYRPRDLARNLHALIDHLGLEDVTLLVHDFGGPIGLSYAIERPENVRSLVLFNTWMWSLAHKASVRWPVKFFATPIGKWLDVDMNFSPRMLVKMVMGDKSKLTRTAHQHYIRPFPRPQDRYAMWRFALHLLYEGDWYEQLWQRRERIADKPALLLWGMKDPFFGPPDLQQWQQALTAAQTRTFPGAGHFVQEEEGASLGPILRDFLA